MEEGLIMVFPDQGPSWERLWSHRPGGPDYSLIPTQQSWPYDAVWSAGGMALLSAWTHYTGMGVSLNAALGSIFFPTPATIVGRYAHTAGASPTFTTGLRQLVFSNPAVVSAGTLAAVPTGLYIANKAVIESAPAHEQPSLWQSFAQALTGTGTGIGGYRGHVE